MRIAVPKEVKEGETRVGTTPEVVEKLVAAGHEVLIEPSAGLAAGFPDESYTAAGAKLTDSAYEAELIVKVKEPQPQEFSLLRDGQTLFCYLHLAANPELERVLQERSIRAVAYENVTASDGSLPLLAPMSQIAGHLSIHMGQTALFTHHGGRGVLLATGAKAVVIGAGSVGTAAAQTAQNLGADVTVLDINSDRLAQFSCNTGLSTPEKITEAIKEAALVVGAVLIPGKKAPHVITEEMLSHMIPGSVIVDVAIDQGGCCATSRPTTHAQPTYTHKGIIHTCIANIPSAVAHTASVALSKAISPYVLDLAKDCH